jgi:hypothetical protein
MFNLGQMVRYVGNGKTFQRGVEIKGNEKYINYGTITAYDGIHTNPETNTYEDYYTIEKDEECMYAHSNLEPIDPDDESAGSWEDVMQEFKVGETA